MQNRKYFYKLCNKISSMDESSMRKLAQAIQEMPEVSSPGQTLEGRNVPVDNVNNNFQLQPQNETATYPTRSRLNDPGQQPYNTVTDFKNQDFKLFPVNTFDGEQVQEKNFPSWVKGNINEYVSSIIEELRLNNDYSNDDLYNYITKKGWNKFINEHNPIKVFLSKDNRDNYVDYVREFQKVTGKSLRDVFMSVTKKQLR